ncbi:MAG: hypothetical protein GTO62_15660, partial [Planctomycetales bacterium]|nr:hypothetical protein [Planctomycetales bacterium]NIP70662.1 hypothetical protein [Planctomycetales bacterium]
MAVDLTLSFRRFSGFDDAGRPSYEEYQENRQTSLIEGNDYLVPLFLPSGSEQQKLSTQELILKISTARAAAASKT